MKQFVSFVSTIALITLALAAHSAAADARNKSDGALEMHTAGGWLDIARAETAQQLKFEAAHPQESQLLLGAGQCVLKIYGGGAPAIKMVIGPPEFVAWWKSAGAAELDKWASDAFPVLLDPEHLMYSVMALYSAQETPRTSATQFINGREFKNPQRFWRYYDRLKTSGMEVYRRGLMGEKLSRSDYNILRLYAPMVYSMWSAPYLPYDLKLTAGDINNYPTAGLQAPDFTLPRLESILKRPAYTDAYTLDLLRPFHSEIASFLLNICDGYEPIPVNARTPNGPLIKARPYDQSLPDCITLSASRGKKPVVLVLNDPTDYYWALTISMLEPLYQATKDKIDWYFICDNIGDNMAGGAYHFPPNQGVQTFQKALSLEERARAAKGLLAMNNTNITIPIILDDMAVHAENAYTDGGGIVKFILIDKNGVICMNNRLFDEPRNYMQLGSFGYQQFAQVHSVAAANIKVLLDNNGVWNGKPAVLPDWQPSPTLDNAKITKLDPVAGMMTVIGADGKDLPIAVDQQTRIIFAQTADVLRSIRDLKIGDTISVMYEPATTPSGHLAHLIVTILSINNFVSWPGLNSTPVWCPAVVQSIGDSQLIATLSPRKKSEVPALKYWAQPNASPLTWEAKTVKDWVEHPDQKLTIHVDRATEVILNGMKAKFTDIRVGDHLGIETRVDQKPDDHRPFFIYVYRYDPSHGPLKP